jgi:hypothetical protein
MSTPLASGFGDFLLTTGPSIYTSPDKFVNGLTKNSYLLKRFTKGREGDVDTFQDGDQISDMIFLDANSTFQYVNPDEEAEWVNPQVLSEWKVYWRFAQDHMSWTDQELVLNGGQDGKVRYKNLKRAKEMRMWTSMLNGMDAGLFAAPNKATMEATSGKTAYSIPAFINAQTNTLFNTVTTAATGGAWTVVQNIDPATKTRWQNQTETYGANGFTVTSGDVVEAFDSMFYKVRFESPGTKDEYFEDPRMYRQFIACSKTGINKYKARLRLSNDLLVTPSKQDPAYMKPQYAGIDLVYVAELDTAELYSKAGATTTLGTESAADLSGPRYYWINANYLRPFFHTEYYFKPIREIQPEKQPNAHVVPVQCWWNLVCSSRRHQGIVSPSADN